MTANDARETLAGMEIEFSDSCFFKYLKAGDREVVELFLDSGLPPDVRDSDRSAAVVVATKAGQKDIARMLLARGASPEPLLNAPPSKKDAWDKLTASSAVLNFVSGLLIAAVGGYFTYSYNRHAAQVLELEAVQRLIPNLMSKEVEEKTAALTAIRDLGDPDLARDFVSLFQGQGAIAVIAYIRDGTDHYGEFRRSGSTWVETYADLQAPRRWNEVPPPPDLPEEIRQKERRQIRLTDAGASIRIDLEKQAIYYSDGKAEFRHLDSIVAVTRN